MESEGLAGTSTEEQSTGRAQPLWAVWNPHVQPQDMNHKKLVRKALQSRLNYFLWKSMLRRLILCFHSENWFWRMILDPQCSTHTPGCRTAGCPPKAPLGRLLDVLSILKHKGSVAGLAGLAPVSKQDVKRRLDGEVGCEVILTMPISHRNAPLGRVRMAWSRLRVLPSTVELVPEPKLPTTQELQLSLFLERWLGWDLASIKQMCRSNVLMWCEEVTGWVRFHQHFPRALPAAAERPIVRYPYRAAWLHRGCCAASRTIILPLHIISVLHTNWDWNPLVSPCPSLSAPLI